MGWASGLQAGINLGEKIRQGQIQGALADEAKKYTPTEGAYGDMSGNIEQVRALQAQNPEQAAQYEPAIAELTRRQGLTAPDYSVGSGGYDGGKNYASLQEAQTAAAPMRTAGLANVYRGYGDVEKASELEARAQQQEMGGLQLGKAKRENEGEVRMGNFNTELNALQNPSTDQIKALAAKHQLDRKQQFEVASQITGIAKSELESHDIDIKNAVKGKNFDQLLDLHKNDKRFGDGVHFVSGKGSGGTIILNLVSDADPTKVIRTQSFKDADVATAYLRKEAEDPSNVAEWMLGMRKGEAAIKASEATANAHNASVGLTGLRVEAFKNEQAGRSEAGKIAAEFDALPLEKQNGPEGLALKNKFNMANAKAGGQISLGAQARPGQTMTDVQKENLRAYRDWEKDDRNKRLPQSEKDKEAARMGVTEFVTSNAGAGAQTGLGSNVYANQPAAEKPQGIQVQPRTSEPKEDSTKYIRSKGVRGNVVYTPSPRGLTKKQYEAMDAGQP